MHVIRYSSGGLVYEDRMKGIILAGGQGQALPGDVGRLEAIVAGLRQADDLLSFGYADVCRHSGNPHHHDTPGQAVI